MISEFAVALNYDVAFCADEVIVRSPPPSKKECRCYPVQVFADLSYSAMYLWPVDEQHRGLEWP